MLGIDRRTLQIAWTLLLFLLAVAAVYSVGRTLVIFALALFLSQLLAPIAGEAQRLIPPRVPRSGVLAIVYVALISILMAILIPLGSRIGEEAAGLATRLPDTIQQQSPLSHVPLPAWLEPARPKLTSLIQDRVKELDQDVLPLLSSAGEHILNGLGSLFSLVLIPILSFFFLKDGAAMREGIVLCFAPVQRALVDDIFSDLQLLLAQYIRALVILSIATLVFYFAFLSIVGVPYAILLAGIAAVLELIPVAGPLAASAVILLVAAFTGYPHLLGILLFLVIYRIFQDYVLNPYLMSSGVEIHPLMVLFGVLAGEQIAGIPGMFFSVPAIAALRVILVRLRRQRQHRVM